MPFHSVQSTGKLPTWYPPGPTSQGSAMSFTWDSTGSWWMMSKKAERRFTSQNSRASADARSKRKPSTCISSTQ